MISADVLIEELQAGRWDERLTDIYVDTDMLPYERKRYINAIKKFKEIFGKNDIQIYSAPGRTEICGNHTDHQNGQVLAAAINRDIIAVVSENMGSIRIKSGNDELIELDINDMDTIAYEEGTSKALVAGMLFEFQKNGYDVRGFDAYLDSDVPKGAGLSSSAAFEIVIGTILSGMFNDMEVSPVKMAFIGQTAENEYFGKPCGLMDQLACSVGDLIYIKFLNNSAPQISKVGFELEKKGYCICITDTAASHSDLTKDYAAVRDEMTAAAKCLGKDKLSDITADEIIENAGNIRECCGDRAFLRALHYVSENNRVQKAKAAIERDDMAEYIKIIRDSGNSSYKYLQNVYSQMDVTHQSLSIAMALSEQILDEDETVRVHGGGFAGTIQAYVRNENVGKYSEYMDTFFGKEACKVLRIRKYGGLKVFTG